MFAALCIAGSDPTGGAGLQLDLRVLQSLGVHGMGVVTALTVQDTTGVRQVLPAFPGVVRDQLRMLLADCQPGAVGAVKLGMLATDDVLRAVDLGLDALEPGVPIVIDPLLAASDGTPLLESRARAGLGELIGRSALVTPNLHEAFELTGCDVSTRAGVEAAARMLALDFGAAAVLVKGGHADGAPDDCLVERDDSGVEISWLAGERIDGPAVHGTGCALASAAAAHLALGETTKAAVGLARELVAHGIREAVALGRGARLLGLP